MNFDLCPIQAAPCGEDGAMLRSYSPSRLSSAILAYLRIVAKKFWLPVGGAASPDKMFWNGKILPYRTAVSSRSSLIDAPFKSTPAKRPRARE
jgi:hypothetical protein